MKTWFKCAIVRAVKTFFQAAVAGIGTSMAMESVNWLAVLSASAIAGILSLCTSLAGLPEVDESQYIIEGMEDDE